MPWMMKSNKFSKIFVFLQAKWASFKTSSKLSVMRTKNSGKEFPSTKTWLKNLTSTVRIRLRSWLKSAKGSTASLRKRTMKSEPLEGKFKSTKKDSGSQQPSFPSLAQNLVTSETSSDKLFNSRKHTNNGFKSSWPKTTL